MIASLLALVLGAADVACTESGRDYRDGAHVLQVVRNRARLRWRGDGTLTAALWARAQHAHGCRWPLTWRHVQLGALFVVDALPVEAWARRALWYCGAADAPGTCEGWAADVVHVGTVRHRFFGLLRGPAAR